MICDLNKRDLSIYESLTFNLYARGRSTEQLISDCIADYETWESFDENWRNFVKRTIFERTVKSRNIVWQEINNYKIFAILKNRSDYQ